MEPRPIGPSDAEAEALVVGAVERPSPSGSEGEVVRYLLGALAPHVDDVRVDEVGNLVARVGSGPTLVTMLGHVDTAPGWWPVRVAGRTLHGRGSVDAKGSLCAMLVAAARLPAALRDSLAVEVVGAVEEEAASSRGARHRLAHGPVPDYTIVGEPSGWDAITLGYKGRVELALAVERPEGHTARDEASAAAQVAAGWTAAAAWADRVGEGHDGAFERVQATLLSIGSSSDGLTQRAQARVAFRLPPTWPPERAAAAAEAAIRAAAPMVGCALPAGSGERAFRAPRDGRLQRALRTAIRAEGARPRHLVKTGTSDMNVVAAGWGDALVAYGPGDATLDHTPDEHLDLDEYLAAVRVLERTLAGLA